MSAMSAIAITLETDWVKEDEAFTWYRHRSGRWEITSDPGGPTFTLWELQGFEWWDPVLPGFELATLVRFVDRHESGRCSLMREAPRPWWRRIRDRLGL